MTKLRGFHKIFKGWRNLSVNLRSFELSLQHSDDSCANLNYTWRNLVHVTTASMR